MYKTGSNRYLGFCDRYNIIPFPVSEGTLLLFVAFLYHEGLIASTVKSYLAAVRHTQISLGLGDPRVDAMPQLEYVTKGLKKRTAGKSSRMRYPITPSILRALKQVWQTDPNKSDAVMLWAVSCMCFFGFLRSGEAVLQSETGTMQRSICPLGMSGSTTW